jgi:hypothetical protein
VGVVRIDDALDKEVEAILQREENRYRYPSKTTLLNIIVHEYLLKLKEKKR